MAAEFKLEERAEEHTGVPVPTLVKYDNGTEEPWCTVLDLDRLFCACANRWGSNWNLEKVVQAINECEFD